MTYEICIVTKEYRWIEVEAVSPESAKNQVWSLVDAGYVGDTKPEDCEHELLIEGIQHA